MLNKKYLIRIFMIFFIVNMFYFISYSSHCATNILPSTSSETVSVGNVKTITVTYKDSNSMEIMPDGLDLNVITDPNSSRRS